jgi:hypothetical protein
MHHPTTMTTGSQINSAKEVRARGDDLMELFDTLGHSNELTQAKLRLEEALMWAVKHATKY